jgi:hypothetical protein
MHKKIFLLFSHKLTEAQSKELKERFNITEFISLPDELQKLWSNFPPEGDFPVELAKKFLKFLKENGDEGDYVLVQGEFGLVCHIVSWCLDNKMIPIYSTTKRIFIDEVQPDGTIKNIHFFKHINFRKYVKFLPNN